MTGRPLFDLRTAKEQWELSIEALERVAATADPPKTPNFSVYIDGHWGSNGRHMIVAIVRAFGQPDVRVSRLPWWAISLAAPFVPDRKELVELKHLWERPVRLSNHRDARPRAPHSAR